MALKKKLSAVATAPVVAQEPDVIDLLVQKSANIGDEEAVAEVRRLLDDGDNNYFQIGGLLSTVKTREGWKAQGFASFKEFLPAVVGMEYRNAMHMIQAYNSLVTCKAKWEEVKDLGWTKLRVVGRVLTEENRLDWFELARSMTVVQLEKHIKQLEAGVEASEVTPPQEASTLKSKAFKLFQDQRELVDEALETAKTRMSVDNDGSALVGICTSYLEKGLEGVPMGGDKVEILKSVMRELGAQGVLEAFGVVFPDVQIEAAL